MSISLRLGLFLFILWGIEVDFRASAGAHCKQFDWNCWVELHWPAIAEIYTECIFERNLSVGIDLWTVWYNCDAFGGRFR